jgi:soluble lytic murein transglycosylase-like protein
VSTPWQYTPTPYDDYFRSYGTQYGVDPRLLRTVASIESDFNPSAISPAGARGLMQFMPDTGAMYGMDDTNCT